MNHYQLEEYQKKGFIVLPKIPLFLEEAIEGKMQESEFSIKFYESDETTVRSYYGFHRDPEIIEWLEKNETLNDKEQKSLDEVINRIFAKI